MSLYDRFADDPGLDARFTHPHGVTWPGDADGYPLLGDIPANIRQDEYEALDRKALFYSYPFKLWDESDRAAYGWVKTRIANGLFFQLEYERRWDADHPHDPVIWLEWVQIYSIAPAGGQDAVQIEISRPRTAIMQVDSPSSWAHR